MGVGLLAGGLAGASRLLRIPAGVFVGPQGFANWIDNIEAGSAAEKALFRLMPLPGGEFLFRQPPRETVPALTALEQQDKSVALYSLRALEEEQALDFDAAERDWKTWAEQASDPVGTHLDLADFYDRRLKPQEELAALEFVGKSPAGAQEQWTPAQGQRAWAAWERALKVAAQFALPRATTVEIYAGFLARYPEEKAPWPRALDFDLDGHNFVAAADLIARYQKQFPEDRVFPVEAEADLAAKQGSAQDGLAVYERSFEPLWPQELIQSYFALVIKSGDQRKFADGLRAKLDADPADLRDAARLFDLYQQEGQTESAKAVLNTFREKKDAAGAAWSKDELETLAQLYKRIGDTPEAARYYYALAADQSAPGAEQEGLVGLTRLLLAAPDQPLRVGAGNLALYENIATMDRGPGYLNGILSLFLNTQDPAGEYAGEDQKAQPYFHRAKAAELLAEIDRRFPNEPARAELHASMMGAYAAYSEDDAVIREGTAILADFPNYAGRVQVAMQVADAYGRTNQTEKEFALYRDLMKELAARAHGMPLGAEGGANSQEYAQVLDRYLSRLVALHQLPDALAVLRGQLDSNPQDPGLYQRLADFLGQNQLDEAEEDVYQKAIQQFQDMGWYAKLARFYLRQRRNADYRALMEKVTQIFSGTELEQFLRQAPAPNRRLAFEVNLYAHQRFPHDMRFVEALLNEYRSTHQDAEAEQLLWQYWTDSPRLRDELFELLSRTGRLDDELATLRQQSPEIEKADWPGMVTSNPAAARFWMEACLWESHFEQAQGAAEALAQAYPADAELDSRTASLFRSLAYFHAEDTDKAVAIDKNLLEAEPGNLDLMARIGDTYADRDRFADADPFWVRMGDARPGESDGYLASATVFWDYYDYADAEAELAKARQRLGDPALFGYQSGAIDENRGDMAGAVREYVASALATSGSDESRARLLELARRPALRDAVEQATAGLLDGATPAAAAIQLRAAVLSAEKRNDELATELQQLVARTSSFDVLDAVTAAAQGNELVSVQEAALERQIALTTDPVHNLQLRYQLVDFYQAHNNAAAAAAEADAIYREHGKILGVVRSTADYDWAHQRKPQAVDVLLDAAQVAYPELKQAFQLEAAQKLTALGQCQRSQTLLTALLAQKPLDASYAAAMADNYARSSDQKGLETFYKAQLVLVKESDLAAADKQQRIAQLRRGMIGAATLLGNTNEAVDQYIELIDAFPDDAALAQEAALYAVAHGARNRLFDFYQKTIAASPRDPRWSIMLARLATAAEDFPLAIDSYAKAIALRPERQDLYTARADLDMRLLRFDDAAADYQKLYTLSYRDPQWMEKLAELRARQGRAADAVQALDTAWVAGNPPRAANFFRVAARLESWGLLEQARAYAERGIEQAGADLLVDLEDRSGAATYARILTRQRQAAAAFDKLDAARTQAENVPITAVVQQAVEQGPGAVTDREWRQQREATRASAATHGFAQAMQVMGKTAGEYYTPEEKMQFASWLQNKCASYSTSEIANVYLPVAEAAGLAELTAEMEWKLGQQELSQRGPQLQTWIQLEVQRGHTEEAAEKIEELADSIAPPWKLNLFEQAGDLYRQAGNADAELRVTEQWAETGTMEGDARQRYYQLLLARDPQKLVALSASEDTAAQYLVRHGSREQALAAVEARSGDREPVWKSSYTALAGFYESDYQPEIRSAFRTALDADATIGERVAHSVDRDQQLAGDAWFYYGSRYGEFLDAAKDAQAGDYLPSEIERTPEDPGAYVQLANYSAQTGRAEDALSDYQHSLDLNADQPAVLNKIATVEWGQGRQADALAAWAQAMKLLAAEIDAKHVPESFWGDFARVTKSAGEHGQYDAIRQQVDELLRVYIRRNEYYRLQPLVEAAYRVGNESADWLISVAGDSGDPESMLGSFVVSSWPGGDGWIEKGQLGTLLARIVRMEEAKVQQNPGEGDESVYQDQQQLVTALIQEKNFTDAANVLTQIPAKRRITAAWLGSVLAVAQANGTLQQLLAQWKTPGGEAPAMDDLRNAAAALSNPAKREVMEYVYERALAARGFSAANFLGLAAIRLDTGDTAGALELLKRMVLVSGDAEADTDAAAHLLEERHKPAQAIPFLRALTESTPWDAGYKVRLGAALLAVNAADAEGSNLLNTVVADSQAVYADRLAAARGLKGHGASSGSAELALVAQSACPAAADAEKPFFVAARQAAAACSTDTKTREQLLREGLAIAPWDAQLRLDYVWVAFAAGIDSRALTAAQPILEPWSEYAQPAFPIANGNSYGAGENYAGGGYTGGQASQPLGLAALPSADAQRLALLVVSAEERHGNLERAMVILNYTLNSVHGSALKEPLEAEQKRLQAESTREAENDAREPEIHKELTQSRVVRERVRAAPFKPIQVSAGQVPAVSSGGISGEEQQP